MMYETSDIPQLLQQHFSHIVEPGLQKEIQLVGKIKHFREGEVIMDYDSYIKMVPLVIKGGIKVVRKGEDGNEFLLYFLNAGDTCSMSFTCCMTNKRSAIQTIAEDDTTILGIPIKHVDEWMSTYKSWKNFVMMSYDNRLLEMVNTIDSIVFKKMDERLWNYLTKKAQTINNDVIATTHQKIAYDLNASREAISRLLKQLEKMGKIQLGRNMIRIKKIK